MKKNPIRFDFRYLGLSAVVLWLLFGSAAAVKARAGSDEKEVTIPWDRVGTAAEKQYQGDGLSIQASGHDALLRCIFQRLEGRAGLDGLWLTSTVQSGTRDRFRVIASAIGRETLAQRRIAILEPRGTLETGEKIVRYIRPGLVEEYSVGMDGVRQDFVVQARPEGEGSLRLDLAVTGARVEPAAFGARLVLNESGRKIAYSRLRVTDSTGRKLEARIEAVIPDEHSVYAAPTPDGLGAREFSTAAADSSSLIPHPSSFALALFVDDREAVYPIRIDPTFSDENWISMGGYPGASYAVNAAIVDAAGNLYIGGDFTVIGSTAANRIAKWDGSSWSALGSGVSSSVMALAVSGTDLYVGGNFMTAGGTSAIKIAKWDGSNWSALGSGMNSQVNALAVSGSYLYVGGYFTTAGGTSGCNGIAKWVLGGTGDSNWSALGSGVSSSVMALAVSGNDLYVGGSFTTAGGTSGRNRIAKWALGGTDNSSWSALGSGVNNTVRALAVSGNDLYVGGDFTTAGGTAGRNRIAKWTLGGTDNGSWSALGSGVNGALPDPDDPDGDAESSVTALVASGTDLYVGGTFTTAGGVSGRSGIAKWALSGTDNSSWSALGSGVDAFVNALAVLGSDLYVGGGFTTVGGTSGRNRIAKWALGGTDNSSWSALGSGVNGMVNALAVSGNDLYIGGDFTTVGSNIQANYIAKWNGVSWSALGSGLNNTVHALAVSGTDLYVGGFFTTAGGTSGRNRIAKWALGGTGDNSWSALGSGMDNRVYALVVSGTDLYAGGNFTMAGGGPANYIAKWNGASWSALGSGLSLYVFALAASGNDLYVGGGFTAAGGTSGRNRIAKWALGGTDNSSWSALGSGVSDAVRALAVSDTDLYVGGDFTMAGGTAGRNRIAKWALGGTDNSSWSALGSGVNNTVRALAVSDTDLYVGGDFTMAGGISGGNRIAKWALGGTDDSSWSALGSGVDVQVDAFAILDSDLYAGGYFFVAGGKASPFLAKAVIASTIDSTPPAVTSTSISITGASGTSGAYKTGDTVTATWDNTSSGDNNSDVASVMVDFSAFGGGSAVAASNSSGTWTATYTIAAGSIDASNRNVSVSATDNAGNVTTMADDTNATVDNQAPVVTAAEISITGASGTGGAYKTGDTVTATWDNTSGGDNNSDTMTGVTVDFSAFGGGSAVVASNSSGTWTASYTIAAGNVDGSSINVSVTAADNAGNVTTRTDDTNATVDNQAPTVTTAKISITGASGTGGAYKIGDTVTTTWDNTSSGDNNSDIAGVTVDFSAFGGGSAVTATDSSGTWTATYTIGAGNIDGSSINVSVTVTDNAGNVTTRADDTNATVDNQGPTVTAAKISITGASGTGGAYKVGDTVTAKWDNTNSGDNNSDAMANVSVNFSAFGGGSAATASNSSGIWTATYTITAGSIDASNLNVSVTVMDNAGNVTTITDDTNATIDNQAPTVTASKISITGASGTSGAYKIGDTVTATWDNTSSGDNNNDIASVTVDFSAFGGGSAVTASNSSGVWTATYTVTAGSIDASGLNISVSVTDNAGNVTTVTDDTNATIDNQAPTVTAAKISITGASGTSGAYKIGDTVMATWNNTSSGDNNSDVASVMVDFSAFGGGSAVIANSSSGAWTATCPIVDGTIEASNRNVSVTVTDNAGNTTTTVDDANAQVDNVAPAAPNGLDLAASSDSGVDTDNITSDNTPIISGTAPAGLAVELFRNGTISLGSTTAGSDGSWSITAITIPDGVHSLTANAKDAVGNVSIASTALSVTIDTGIPSISDVADQTIDEDGATADLTFTVSDTITGVSDLVMDADSSNTALVKKAKIVFSGSGGTRTVKVTPESNENGQTTITLTVKDQAGNTQQDTFVLTVNAVNDAPVLAAFGPTLTSITEDQTSNGGQTVASIVGTSISDVDNGAVQGIAITNVVAGNSKWQYSMDSGANWTDVGTVSPASALLLKATDLVRYVPDEKNGITASFTYRAWDQTGGTAGTKADASVGGDTTAFSTNNDTATITVTSVNDAPVVANNIPGQSGGYGGSFSYAVASNTFSDVDSGDTIAYSASGLPPGLSFNTATRVISGTMTAAGIYTVTVTGTDSGNAPADASFTFTVNKAALTITAENKTKVYGATLPTLTATYVGLTNNDTSANLDIPAILSSTGTASSAMGTYPITASGASDANYTISYVAGTLTVTPATLTIKANDQVMTYGDPVPELTVTYTGLVNGDVIASIPEAVSLSTTATSTSNVGTYPIFVSGGSSSNYTIQRVQGTLTINKPKLIVKADDKSRKYQSANPTFTSTVTGAKNGEVIQVTYSTSATINSPVGTYSIVVGISSRQRGIGNYDVTLINGTLTIQDQADLAGLVHDGYVAGGTVFFDANNNRVLDAGEPSATTDDNGQFNISVKVSDFDKNKDGQLDTSEGVLVVAGGVDIATGLPLQTSLTAPYGSTVLNPLTTLVSAALDQNPALSVAEAESSVAAGLGLSGVSLTQYDAFGGAKNNDPSATAVLSAGAKVQDSLVQVTALLTAASGQDSSSVAQAVAQALSAAVSSGGLDLSQPTAMQQVIEVSAANTGATLNGQVAAKAAEVIAQGNQLIDQVSAMTGSGAEIALEISRKQGVSQGDVTATLQEAAVAEAGDVQKIIDEATQQQNQSSSVVGVLDGEDSRPGAFNFSQKEYEIQDLSKESAPITIFRIDGSKGAGTVVLALSLATGQDALTIPVNFANREIRKTVDVLGLVRTNQLLLGAEEVAMHLLQSQSGSTNQAGLGETNRATLVLRSAPVWTAQPIDTDSMLGERVEMHAIASGSPKPVYQWYKDGVLLPGQTSYELVLDPASLSDGGKYYATASNVVGVITSQSATLNVLASPVVSQSTMNKTAIAGTDVSFTVEALGSSPLSYQWKRNGVVVAGQNGATLQLSHADETDTGDYTVTVSNAYGVTSVLVLHLEVQKPSLAILTMSRPVNGRMIVPLQGSIGQRARLEASVDLMNWVTVTEVIFEENRTDYVETEFSKQPKRFYRLITETP